MIIVTGASGQLGRTVVEELLDRIAPDRIGVSVRDPDAVRDLAERGVRVRTGDFGDPAGLALALEGAERVLIVSANAQGVEAIRLNTNAVTAAREAGAERIFYTSHVGVDPDSAFPPMRAHAATERFLAEAGVAYTAVRNGFYAEFAPAMMGNAVESGELRGPADGPMSWTTHPDLAAATAALLATEDGERQTVSLTASEALTWADIAELATEITGRPIRRVVVDDEEFAASMAERGVPEERVASGMGIYQASRAGQFSEVDPALERLIGRPPTPFRDVLERALSGPGPS